MGKGFPPSQPTVESGGGWPKTGYKTFQVSQNASRSDVCRKLTSRHFLVQEMGSCCQARPEGTAGGEGWVGKAWHRSTSEEPKAPS